MLVENRPGVLTRWPACSRGAGSTSSRSRSAPTEDPARSRITIRVDCSQHSVDQVIKQLYKLIDVLKVQELARPPSSSSC